ncbi:hypothetical protein ACQY1Q_08460 [Tenacibaculum sp. TC6]|uniref:hypothetical protein n=1 Tax=Tenacibaculum sp. TC6 TaxID=3423223 RepID=UPI003D35ABEE
MTKIIFNSERYFTVYDYNLSHGQLLIRSDKRKGYDNNIDILFFDTQYIQIFNMLDGITIKLSDKTVSNIKYESVSSYLKYEDNNLFEIESGGISYFIAASFVKIYENRLEHFESSIEMHEKGNLIGSSI